MKKLLGPVVLALLGMLAGVPNALAGETKCIGSLPAGTHDNVVVPAGKMCEMSNVTVKGNVKVYGALDVFAPATIGGDIQGEPGHTYVRLWGTDQFTGAVVAVRGNVQLKGSREAGGYLDGTRIGGNFQWQENSADVVAFGGTIGGDLQVEKSQGTNPGNRISRNAIRGNLQCKENSPAPYGSNNTVGGTKDGQCAGL